MDHVVIEERCNYKRQRLKYVPLVYGTEAQCKQIADWMTAHCEPAVPHITLRFVVRPTTMPTPEQAQANVLDWVQRLLCASVGPSFTDGVGQLLKAAFPAPARVEVPLAENVGPVTKPPQAPPTGP